MSYRDSISVCAIACGEIDYIAEWIEFHILQGVEHFYLNLNNPIDATPQLLENHYKDVVTLSSFPMTPEDALAPHIFQLKAYADLVLRAKARNKSGWLAIIDVDEFLYSPRYWNLPKALEHYRDVGISCIGVKWLMFGDSGHYIKTPGLVIERFTKRQEGTHPHCKSVFKTNRFVDHGGDCHTVKVKGLIINEKGKPLPKDTYAVSWEPGTADILAINHYHLKSYEECMKRIAFRDGKATEIKDKQKFYDQDNYNDVWDDRLVRFNHDIKMGMKRRGL